MQKQIANWNSARDVWETVQGQKNVICGHSGVFSETWPTSGMMRNGVAFQLPTQARRITATGSLLSQPAGATLFRTPTASEVGGGMMHPEKARREGRTVRLASQLVELANPGQLLPTPTCNDAKNSSNPPSQLKRKSPPLASVSSHFPDLDWGKYRTAVEWWESVFRPAPKPTEVRPNGRHRLSVEFPEWMMGLEPGHVSKVEGITHNQKIKALGNGVQVQQAIRALEDMLDAR